VHRVGYGAPHAAIPPRTGPVSPSPSPRFSPAPRAVNAALRHRVLPMANARPSSPRQAQDDTRRGSPVRAWYALPSRLHARAVALFSPFPLRGSGARGTPAHASRAGPQAGQLGEGRELHPPLFGLAIVGPRLSGPYGSPYGLPPVFPGGRASRSPSAPCCLTATSALAAAAHVIEVCVPSMPWPGLAPGFPRSALGVWPRRPLPGRPTSSPGSPQVCGLQSSRRLCPDALRLVLHEPGFPPACSSPGRGGRWRPPLPPRPAPAPTGKQVTSSLGTTPPPQKFWVPALAPKGTSIRPPLSLPIACNHGLS
jgi:hypothetical protein